MTTYKKGYEVIPYKPEAKQKTYKVGNREFKFKGHNQFYVTDPAVGKELEAKYGGTRKSEMNMEGDDLRVIPINDLPADGFDRAGHRYSFSTPRGNWKERIDWEA